MEEDFDLEDVFNDEGKELHAKQRPEARISPSSKLSRDTPGWVASLSRCGEKSIFSDATRTACVPPASPGVPSCFAGKTYFQAGSASEGCPPLSSPRPSQETCFSSSLPRQCHQSLPTSASQGGDKPHRIWPSAFLSSKQNPHGAESRGVRTPEGPAEARLQVPQRTWGKLSALKSESGAGNPAPVEPRAWGDSLSLSLGKPAEVSKAPDNQKDRADSRRPPPRLPAGRPGGGRLWADLGKGSFLCSGASQEGTFKFQPSRDSGHPNAFEAEPPTSPEKSTYAVAQEVPLASRPRDLGCTYTASLVPNAARGPSRRESLGTETQPAGVSSQSQTAHFCPSRNVARKSSQWLAASGGRIPQDDASEHALGQTRSASGAGFASSPFQSFAERFPSQRRETLAKTTNVDAPPVPRARLRGCGLQVKPELRGVCTPRQVTQESRGHQAEDRGRGQRIERETIGSDLSNAENRGGGFCKTTRTPKLAGPAGVLLRRRQQADPAKRMKTESSRSPVASGTPRSAQGRSPQPSPDREDVECVDSEEDSELDGQNLGRNVAWIKALFFASLPLDDFHLGLTPFPSEAADLSCSFMYRDNISSILNRVAPAAYKVPQLIVSIKTSVARSRSAEATEEKVEEALLQVTDPTGEMPAAVHSRAVSLHGANFVSGAALLLRDVTVFLSNCRLPCLAIVHANILQIFPPEDWTASFQAAFSVERNKEALLTRVSDAGSKKFPSISLGPLSVKAPGGVGETFSSEHPPLPQTHRERSEAQETERAAGRVFPISHVKEEMRSRVYPDQSFASQGTCGQQREQTLQSTPIDDTSLLIEDLEGVEDSDAFQKPQELFRDSGGTGNAFVSDAQILSCRSVSTSDGDRERNSRESALTCKTTFSGMASATDGAEKGASLRERESNSEGSVSSVSVRKCSRGETGIDAGGEGTDLFSRDDGEENGVAFFEELSKAERQALGPPTPAEIADREAHADARDRTVGGESDIRASVDTATFSSTAHLDDLLDILLEEPDADGS